jgi:hypothetical protein
MNYDPSILVAFAMRLYSQANSIIALSTILGVISGAAAGGIVLSALNAGTVGVAIGALLFGLLGYMIGRERAFRYKLEAQRTLCALQTEINTRPANQGAQYAQAAGAR